jgi:hypothetical protein
LDDQCNQYLTKDRGWFDAEKDLAHLPDVEIASVGLVYGEPGSQYGTPALLAITAGRAMK